MFMSFEINLLKTACTSICDVSYMTEIPLTVALNNVSSYCVPTMYTCNEKLQKQDNSSDIEQQLPFNDCK